MKNAARAVLTLATVASLLAAARGVRAQFAPEPLGRAPWSHMHTLLEKTLLHVDVLTVDICFDAATATRFAAIAARSPLKGAAADSITRAALAGRRAVARVEFQRDVSLAEFLDGVRADLRNAVAAGVMEDSVSRVISSGLPRWYAFAAQRGIRKGDQILYDMEPDAIRTRFFTREGTTPLDNTEHGRGRRNSPMATWLAAGSEFRSGLLASLQREGARGGAAAAARCHVPAGRRPT